MNTESRAGCRQMGTGILAILLMAAALAVSPAYGVNCDKKPDHPQCDGGGGAGCGVPR